MKNNKLDVFVKLLVLSFGLFLSLHVGAGEEREQKVVVGSQATIKADESYKELIVVAGRVDVYGELEKVVVIGGHVHLRAGAKVTKEIHKIGGQVDIDPAATVAGKYVEMGLPISEKNWNFAWSEFRDSPFGSWITSTWAQLIYILIKTLILLSVAVLADYIAPNFQQRTFFYFKDSPLVSLFWGMLSVLFVLPMTAILALSIIGIPFLPLQFSLLCLFVLLGYLHSSRWLAQKALALLGREENSIDRWLVLLMGLLLLDAFRFLPWVGDLLKVLLTIAGFGATSKMFYRSVFERKEAKATY